MYIYTQDFQTTPPKMFFFSQVCVQAYLRRCGSLGIRDTHGDFMSLPPSNTRLDPSYPKADSRQPPILKWQQLVPRVLGYGSKLRSWETRNLSLFCSINHPIIGVLNFDLYPLGYTDTNLMDIALGYHFSNKELIAMTCHDQHEYKG